MTHVSRGLLFAFEILIVCALTLTTRCANYQDVFVGGHIYFTDADCYARMTRVRLCSQHPGLVLRHHSFENSPQGTTPHTTAPLDYAILTLNLILQPFTSRAIDLAGALISPLLALIGAVFLCWWSHRMRLSYRWVLLTLYIFSPILVHGTALGRPDHQSLALLLVVVGVCADWARQESEQVSWSIASGLAWGMAIWVSAYEPLILFAIASLTTFGLQLTKEKAEHGDSKSRSKSLSARPNWLCWLILTATLAFALLVERRIPSFSVLVSSPIAHNWARTVGELAPIPLISKIWFSWVGWTIVVVPFLIGIAIRAKRIDCTLGRITILAFLTCCLTMWQARWGYYFAAMFGLGLPLWLGAIRSKSLAWTLFLISLWPLLRDWDQRIWPNEVMASRQIEQRHEAIEMRELSLNLISPDRRPFLAPWWLSPAIAYWSGQPGVAGSSHESLTGIADTAEFYLVENPTVAEQILAKHRVAWVVGYDADRVIQNSAAILGKAAPGRCLARVLDQRPMQAPVLLLLSAQNGTAKIFQVTQKW